MGRGLRTAKPLLDVSCHLGEGAVWDKRNNCLYWVDILQKRIHKYNNSTGENLYWKLPSYVSKIFPVEYQSGKFVVALQDQLAIWYEESQEIIPLTRWDTAGGQIRTNDGGIDPDGNIWIGTMHMEALPNSGKLMCFRNAILETAIPNVSIPNGLVWSKDRRYFYFIDSQTREIRRYVWNPVAIEVSSYTTLVRVPDSLGMPDGMCIGSDGHLWVAHWGGFGVYKWHIDTGELLDKIHVDAPHVTSCCFGGPWGKELFITTAKEGLTREELEQFPNSGKIFHFCVE